jgi:NADPH:quinone reductase-like Zn-dependent oxidoreductase
VTAKCINFYEFGNPHNVLKVEDKKIQRPMNGDVQVRMTLRPINPSDLIPIRGAYSHRITLPATPGYEGVGIVEEVGSTVSKELLGKRVLPLRGEGTWQELVTTSAEFCVPIPESLEDYEAAQLYINPLTAWLICTKVLDLSSNDVILVNACGSSIGYIFAQLSKILGFRLIAVTRSHVYTEELLQLGASDVINTSDRSLYHTVMELTNGQGANAVIDSVGGPSGTELAYCVRPNGVVLSIGLLSGIPVNTGEIARRTKANMKMFHLRHWNQQVSVQIWQKTFKHLIQLIEGKRLKLERPHAQYRLLEVKEAVQAAEYANRRGKILLTC